MADDEPTEDSSGATTAAMVNVSIKLPPFWSEVWSAEVEAHYTSLLRTLYKLIFTQLKWQNSSDHYTTVVNSIFIDNHYFHHPLHTLIQL